MILITKEAAEEIEANIEEYKIYDRQYLKPMKLPNGDFYIPKIGNNPTYLTKLQEKGFVITDRPLTQEEIDFLTKGEI